MPSTVAPGILYPDELVDLGNPRTEAKGLAGRLYTDPAIFEAEKERIFRREWMAVIHESSVPKEGDFRVVEVAGDSLLFVRGGDGQLRCFHNICRHRGAKVAADEQGSCSRFRCPYHKWTYDLEGNLVGAPTMSHVVDEGIGLVEVPLDTWMGFVFVNQDGNAEPLAEKLADLSERLAPWLSAGPLEELYEIRYPGKWNWKLTFENANEGYHVIGSHYDSAEWLIPGELTYAPEDASQPNYTTYRMPFVEGKSMRDFAFDAVPMDDLPDWVDKEFRFFLVYPNFLISVAPDNVTGYMTIPGPTPGDVTFVWNAVVRPETKQQPRFEEYQKVQMEWSNTIQGEDQYPCETMWANVHSPAFIPGRYAEGENAVYEFDQWYLERMSG